MVRQKLSRIGYFTFLGFLGPLEIYILYFFVTHSANPAAAYFAFAVFLLIYIDVLFSFRKFRRKLKYQKGS